MSKHSCKKNTQMPKPTPAAGKGRDEMDSGDVPDVPSGQEPGARCVLLESSRSLTTTASGLSAPSQTSCQYCVPTLCPPRFMTCGQMGQGGGGGRGGEGIVKTTTFHHLHWNHPPLYLAC
jgi:hypothetical protein